MRLGLTDTFPNGAVDNTVVETMDRRNERPASKIVMSQILRTRFVEVMGASLYGDEAKPNTSVRLAAVAVAYQAWWLVSQGLGVGSGVSSKFNFKQSFPGRQRLSLSAG